MRMRSAGRKRMAAAQEGDYREYMKYRSFIFKRWLAALIATTLVCGGIASSALAQTTNKSTHAKSKSSRVNVNTADVKTLETLPGVTATLANKIVAGRPYKSIDDLRKVKGMTQTKLDGLKNHVTFSGTTASHKKKSAVASTEEGATNATRTARNSTKSSTEEEESSAPLAATGAATGRSSGTSGSSATPKKTGPSEPININTASLDQLEQLPGIGPTHAQAIIDYRQQNGNFGSIEDIEKVKGIKEGEFSKIKDMIKVSE